MAPGASRHLSFGKSLSHSHFAEQNGALAQLGERLICIQEVRSSILLGSTTPRFARRGEAWDLPCVNRQVDRRVAPPNPDFTVKHLRVLNRPIGRMMTRSSLLHRIERYQSTLLAAASV